jgi:uncharacterized protein (TIGR03000 family)
MFHTTISALRTGALAAAMLAFAATPAFAQHHGGGGHGGGHGGHASGGHGGHGGSYHGGYYHGGYGHGGYHHGGYAHGGYYGRGYYGWPGYGVGLYAWPYLSGYGYRDYYYPSYPRVIVGTDYYAPDYYYPPTVSGYYSPPDVTVVNPTAPTPAAPAADAAQVEVHVPPDAQVWFDGNPTTQTGELRTYVSPPLPADKPFHYDIRARWTDNGKVVDQTRSVEVRAGRRTTVDFMQPQP